MSDYEKQMMEQVAILQKFLETQPAKNLMAGPSAARAMMEKMVEDVERTKKLLGAGHLDPAGLSAAQRMFEQINADIARTQKLLGEGATARFMSDVETTQKMFDSIRDTFKAPDAEASMHLPATPKPPVQWWYERIARQINEFEDSLDENEEVGARFIAAAGEGVLHIDDVTYWAPDMLIFEGENDQGRKAQVIMHYTQVQITLVAIPVDKGKANRIGFHLIQRVDEAESDAAADPL